LDAPFGVALGAAKSGAQAARLMMSATTLFMIND